MTDSITIATFLDAMQPPSAVTADRRHAAMPGITGEGNLPSAFPLTAFAVAAIGTAALALADYVDTRFGHSPAISIDRRLASFWFGTSVRPQGWQIPALRDPVTGDYQARDGWVRLHANAPHHLVATLSVLGTRADPGEVARTIAHWHAAELEDAIVRAGGCAATMHGRDDWLRHPQGQAVRGEPVIHAEEASKGRTDQDTTFLARPLAGVKVLDLTRVLAGPVATRFLAGYGAQVLRIDPPFWTEPGMVPEVTLGKRCAQLDLRKAADLARLKELLALADVVVHGYRGDALDGLGLGTQARHALRPGLVDVSLNAYGWTGPWRSRRGFDSLVQMSDGIASAGMRYFGRDKPTPLPVQALDHATGYLVAAAVLRGLARREQGGYGSVSRLSLARTGELLVSQRGGALTQTRGEDHAMEPETAADHAVDIEQTDWGPARRLKPPCELEGIPMRWDLPATALRSSAPHWA